MIETLMPGAQWLPRSRQAVWFLKCRALTLQTALDDTEFDDDGVADMLMDDNATSSLPRQVSTLLAKVLLQTCTWCSLCRWSVFQARHVHCPSEHLQQAPGYWNGPRHPARHRFRPASHGLRRETQ